LPQRGTFAAQPRDAFSGVARPARDRARPSRCRPCPSPGRDSGVGLGYGVALDVNVARGLHGAIGWEQHDFHFVGQRTSNVTNVTLALGYAF
jgi:hypothetical protein